MSYVPSTKSEREQMLKKLGVDSFDALFSSVPENVKLKDLMDMPKAKSEIEVIRFMEALADKNTRFKTIFRGAGAYNHYIPSVVKSLASRSEFVTGYTPYQAEISQGVLQVIFEYQTMIAELTGMDVSNASIYDGAVAAAEAVNMCCDKKKNKVLVSKTVNPQVLEVIKTYCFAYDFVVEIIPSADGITDVSSLEKIIDDSTACVYSEQPNFFGNMENADKISEITHAKKAKYIMGVNPISLGLFKTPAEYGADIAVGEGQPLGMPLSFGGPYLGFMASTKDMMRKLPGRIVGETIDAKERRAYVLTLQAREQHIRREKASSSICTNQALCALTAAVYMGAMGPEGLSDVAQQCYSKAHYLADEISKIKGFSLKYNNDFFHEFVITSDICTCKISSALEEKGILGGYPLNDKDILWCCTEMNTKEEMDSVVSILKEVSHNG